MSSHFRTRLAAISHTPHHPTIIVVSSADNTITVGAFFSLSRITHVISCAMLLQSVLHQVDSYLRIFRLL